MQAASAYASLVPLVRALLAMLHHCWQVTIFAGWARLCYTGLCWGASLTAKPQPGSECHASDA